MTVTGPSTVIAGKSWRRSARPATRAEPACLLGYSAYVRGEGAFAGMALEAALHASPEHVLAGLLSDSIRLGVPPEQLTRLAPHDGAPDWLSEVT
jgi:hypothetical protein